MPQSHRHFKNARDYTFGCPDGEWTAQLDHKAWGKRRNMIPYFMEPETGAKRWLWVFWNDGFKPRDGSFDFRNDGYPGELFMLTTTPEERKSGIKIRNPHQVSRRADHSQERLCCR